MPPRALELSAYAYVLIATAVTLWSCLRCCAYPVVVLPCSRWLMRPAYTPPHPAQGPYGNAMVTVRWHVAVNRETIASHGFLSW